MPGGNAGAAVPSAPHAVDERLAAVASALLRRSRNTPPLLQGRSSPSLFRPMARTNGKKSKPEKRSWTSKDLCKQIVKLGHASSASEAANLCMELLGAGVLVERDGRAVTPSDFSASDTTHRWHVRSPDAVTHMGASDGGSHSDSSSASPVRSNAASPAPSGELVVAAASSAAARRASPRKALSSTSSTGAGSVGSGGGGGDSSSISSSSAATAKSGPTAAPGASAASSPPGGSATPRCSADDGGGDLRLSSASAETVVGVPAKEHRGTSDTVYLDALCEADGRGGERGGGSSGGSGGSSQTEAEGMDDEEEEEDNTPRKRRGASDSTFQHLDTGGTSEVDDETVVRAGSCLTRRGQVELSSHLDGLHGVLGRLDAAVKMADVEASGAGKDKLGRVMDKVSEEITDLFHVAVEHVTGVDDLLEKVQADTAYLDSLVAKKLSAAEKVNKRVKAGVPELAALVERRLAVVETGAHKDRIRAAWNKRYVNQIKEIEAGHLALKDDVWSLLRDGRDYLQSMQDHQLFIETMSDEVRSVKEQIDERRNWLAKVVLKFKKMGMRLLDRAATANVFRFRALYMRFFRLLEAQLGGQLVRKYQNLTYIPFMVGLVILADVIIWVLWSIGFKWIFFAAVCYAVYEYFVALA